MLAALAAIAEFLVYFLGTSLLVYGVWSVLPDAAKQKLINSVTNVVRASLLGAIALLNDTEGDLAPIVNAFADAIQKYGAPIADDLKAPFANFGRRAFEAASSSLEGKTNIKPEDWKTIAGDALADAFGFGLSSFGVSAAFEAVFPEKLNTLNGIGPMLSTLAGFHEVSAATLRPLLGAGIAIPAGYDANQKFRSRLPALGATLALWARRKITDAERDKLLAYNGISPDWVAALEAGAYRPLQPRALVNLLRDQPINRNELVGLLEDAALSPAHVQSLADKIIYNSDANVRNSLLSATITGYGKGVISDQELANTLTQFNFSPEAKQYVTSHALILRREVLAAEAEKTIIPLVANGNITAQVGLQQLEAAGVEPWYAQLQIDLATTRATIHGMKLAAEAARHLAVAREREAQRAAVAQFEDGTINAAGLSAALLLAGIDPLIAGMVVSVETAKQAGRMQVVFNQLLPPLQAKVLRETVAAIEQQTKDQLITLGQATTQLQALSLDQAEIDALVARWAATLKKSPGAAVYQTP